MKEYQKNIKFKNRINKKRTVQSNKFDNYNNIEIKDENNMEDDRLTYVLETLGLDDLTQVFNENKISFSDLLLLSKESLKELGLEMYQRNRIYNFSTSFNKKAKTYSINEISKFFNSNKQFLFSPIKMLKENKTLNYDNDTNNINSIKKNYFSYNENYNNDNYKIQKIINNPSKIRSSIKSKYSSSRGKSYKASKIFKKYLLIKKGVDEFLTKLDRQKEETENMTNKLNNIIKRINSNKDINYNNNFDDNNNLSYKNLLSNKNTITKNFKNNGWNNEKEKIF